MERDPLEPLLRRVDASVPVTGPAPEDVAGRVRAVDRRRRRATRTGLGLAAAALLVALSVWFDVPRDPPEPAGMTDARVAAIQAELVALDREAALHEAVADRLLIAEAMRERRRPVRPTQSEPDPRAAFLAEVESVATLMVLRVDRSLDTDAPSARERYQRVIDLYPDTRAAETAKQRLSAQRPESNTQRRSRERQRDV